VSHQKDIEMEIATNAVLAAMLMQASVFVRSLDLPMETPLQQSNVVVFRAGARWNQAESDVNCYLAYRGGYEFRFAHGYIDSFNTRDSYSDLQNPSDLPKLAGEAQFTEAECLAKVKKVFRNLGYTNVSLLSASPEVRGPIPVGDRTVPRFIFRWPRPGEPKFSDARVEVNAARLTLEHVYFGSPAFWRKPWPVTFGTTNSLQQALGEPPPASSKRTELDVHDVTREYGAAYIQAILPEINRFCSKLGPPFPDQVSMGDISMGESEVSMKFGRVSVCLRLKSGHKLVFTAGHVWAVHAPDAYYTSPWWREEVRQSQEYLAPTRVTAQEAVDRVRRLLLHRLDLDEKLLYLDTEPVFSLRPSTTATNGIRRYVFQWQAPETAQERDEHRRNRILPQASVSAEIDAVSGVVKTLNLFHRSLERPDPIVAQPIRGQEP
jgi:hypothetical protein